MTQRLAMIGLDAAELSFVREHAAALPVLSRLLGDAKPLESTAARRTLRFSRRRRQARRKLLASSRLAKGVLSNRCAAFCTVV